MIPEWTSQGVLPPISAVAERSPYRTSLTDLVLRYATSATRNTILQGLVSFRQALHALGLDSGFQWVDGSFVENVELIENRAPHDVDVVTFYYSPGGQTQEDLLSLAPGLFTPSSTKATYHVDAYFVELNGNTPAVLVGQTTYWHSLWSHRRNEQWKGYLQVDLSSADDQAAQANLDQAIRASLDQAAKQGDQP